VLLDQRTVALVGDQDATRFTKLESAELKGFARPVAMFAAERA
jgi:class 3 adenylate cyclase